MTKPNAAPAVKEEGVTWRPSLNLDERLDGCRLAEDTQKDPKGLQHSIGENEKDYRYRLCPCGETWPTTYELNRLLTVSEKRPLASAIASKIPWSESVVLRLGLLLVLARFIEIRNCARAAEGSN